MLLEINFSEPGIEYEFCNQFNPYISSMREFIILVLILKLLVFSFSLRNKVLMGY